MISWRHKIHRNPEAAYTEFNTATLVTDALRIFGFVMVPGAGLEPAQCCHRRILSPSGTTSHDSRQPTNTYKSKAYGKNSLYIDVVCCG